MHSTEILAFLAFLAVAAADIVMLQRRLQRKVNVGAIAQQEADRKSSYQWRLFAWVVMLGLLSAIGVFAKL